MSDIYDPISKSLNMNPIDTEIPSIKELTKLFPPTHRPVPWNKGMPHVEGQKLSLENRMKNGTHNFIDPEKRKEYVLKRKLSGSYSERGKIVSAQMYKNNTHPFLHIDFKQQQKKLLENGVHHSQIEYHCPHCNKIGKGNTMKKHHFDRCKEKK